MVHSEFKMKLNTVVLVGAFFSASRVDAFDDKQVFALCKSDLLPVCAGEDVSAKDFIDAGSFAANGSPILRYSLSPAGPFLFQTNNSFPVKLTVQDEEGNTDACTSMIAVHNCTNYFHPRRELVVSDSQKGSSFNKFCNTKGRKPIKVHGGHQYSNVVVETSLIILPCYYKCTKRRRRRRLQVFSDALNSLPDPSLLSPLSPGSYATYPPGKSDPDFWYYRLPFNKKQLNQAGSAKFRYDGGTPICTNQKPFSAFGKFSNDTFVAQLISFGCHSLRMTLYNSTDCSGLPVTDTAKIDLFGVAVPGSVQLTLGAEKDGQLIDSAITLSTSEVTIIPLDFYKARLMKLIVDPGIFPGGAGSVSFTLETGKKYCSNAEPYNAFGLHGDGSLRTKVLPLGPHNVTVTSYNSTNCSTGAGNSSTYGFLILANSTVGKYNCPGEPAFITLYNAETDSAGNAIDENTTFCIPDYEFTFKAVVINCARDRVQSTQFVLSGAFDYTFVDRGPFFGAFGDDNKGDIFGRETLPPGPYTLTATTYSERGAQGLIGGTYKIKFNLRDCSVSPILCTNEVTGFKLLDKKGVVSDPLPPVISYTENKATAFSIEAVTKSCLTRPIGSVKLQLADGDSRCETEAPYTLFGDTNGINKVQTLAIGQIFQVSATPYTSTDCTTGAGTELIQQFVVKGVDNAPNCPGEPVLFSLKTASGAEISIISEGSRVCVPTVPFNIEAVIVTCVGASVGSTVFKLTGPSPVDSVDRSPPYFLYAEKGNDPKKSFAPGNYTLTATPFESPSAKGVAGGTLVVHFTAVKC